jgi:hypothetical protein
MEYPPKDASTLLLMMMVAGTPAGAFGQQCVTEPMTRVSPSSCRARSRCSGFRAVRPLLRLCVGLHRIDPPHTRFSAAERRSHATICAKIFDDDPPIRSPMAGMRRDVACHPAVTQANQFAYYHKWE